MLCSELPEQKLRIRALTNMEALLNSAPLSLTAREGALFRLRTLTSRETEVCLLHLADCRSQTTISEWLGLSLRTVGMTLESAMRKVPELKALRVKAGEAERRPRVVHLSQLPSSDRSGGPFNIDEL